MAAPGVSDRGSEKTRTPDRLGRSEDADLAKLIAGAAARYSHTLPVEPKADTVIVEPKADTVIVEPKAGTRTEPETHHPGGKPLPPPESLSSIDSLDAPHNDTIRNRIPAVEVEAREEKLSAEIEYLKNQLEDRERAAREALNAAAQLNEQLSSTKAQAETSRNQVHGGHKARIERAESAVAQLKTQLHLVQYEAERERRAHRSDNISATSRVSQMESEIAVMAAAQMPPKVRSKGNSRARWIAIGAATLISLASGMLYLLIAPAAPGLSASGARSGLSAGSRGANLIEPNGGDEAQTSRLRSLARRFSPPAAAAAATVTPGREPEPDAKTDFTQSLDRLNSALTAFPGLTPTEVLRLVAASGGKNSVCAIQWNNGNPALVFNGSNKGSLAQTLASCAQAVEKFR